MDTSKLEARIFDAINNVAGLDDISNNILNERIYGIGRSFIRGEILSISSDFVNETKEMLGTREGCDKLKTEISKIINTIF